MIMALGLADLEYLANVLNAVKSDNPPEIPDICPECDEQAEEYDTFHITLNTRIPGYWAERGDWGQPNPYGMNDESAPLILIGCEGYHTLPQFSNAR